MHCLRFGKRQTPTHEATEPLAQRVIPSLNVRRLPQVFTTGRVLIVRYDLVIGFQEIRVAMAGLISFRNRFPELATSLLTTVADDVSHNLARCTAQRKPDPAFVDAPEDKEPHLVQL